MHKYAADERITSPNRYMFRQNVYARVFESRVRGKLVKLIRIVESERASYIERARIHDCAGCRMLWHTCDALKQRLARTKNSVRGEPVIRHISARI